MRRRRFDEGERIALARRYAPCSPGSASAACLLARDGAPPSKQSSPRLAWHHRSPSRSRSFVLQRLGSELATLRQAVPAFRRHGLRRELASEQASRPFGGDRIGARSARQPPELLERTRAGIRSRTWSVAPLHRLRRDGIDNAIANQRARRPSTTTRPCAKEDGFLPLMRPLLRFADETRRAGDRLRERRA